MFRKPYTFIPYIYTLHSYLFLYETEKVCASLSVFQEGAPILCDYLGHGSFCDFLSGTRSGWADRDEPLKIKGRQCTATDYIFIVIICLPISAYAFNCMLIPTEGQSTLTGHRCMKFVLIKKQNFYCIMERLGAALTKMNWS